MKLFGTDGLRGHAGEFPLDPASVRLIGEELGRLAKKENRPAVVGGDTRESTPELLAELVAGIRASGGQVRCAGTITTPGVAELVLALGASSGVSVSASHNPWEDNGIKIFGSDGKKWPDAWENELETALLARRSDAPASSARSAEPALEPDPRLAAAYLERLEKRITSSLNNIYIVVDAGNGAAFRLAPAAFHPY